TIANDSTNYPLYATVNIANPSTYTWAATTVDVRAPVKGASATDRIASCWYSGSTITMDVNLTDGQTHRVALYGLDWDSTSRSQNFEIDDPGSGAVLAGPRPLSTLSNGHFMGWGINGHATLQIT